MLSMNSLAVLCVVVFLSGCALPVDSKSKNVPETNDPAEGSPATNVPEAPETRVPQWHLFLGGPDLHLSDGRMIYYDQPLDSDRHAGVIPVRVGDEQQPEKWVHLYLEMQRTHGDQYFLSLIASNKVTLFDLVVIDSLLVSAALAGTEPPLSSTLSVNFGQTHPLDLHAFLNGNIPGQGGPPGPNKGVTPHGPFPNTPGLCDGLPCAWADTSGVEWQPIPVTTKWVSKFDRFFRTCADRVEKYRQLLEVTREH